MARKVTAAHAALRQSEHNTVSPDPTHNVVAVSPGGRTLWVTDSYYAGDNARARFNDEYADEGKQVIDGEIVEAFELREA